MLNTEVFSGFHRNADGFQLNSPLVSGPPATGEAEQKKLLTYRSQRTVD